MEKVHIEEKYIPEYVGDMLSSLKCGTEQVSNTNAKFHHNTDYEQVPSVIKYGILSLQELNKLGLKNYSEKLLKLMSNIDSHVNGDTGISLSVTGLEDLYLDVVITNLGEIIVLDEDELEQALEENYITKEQYDMAIKVGKNIIQKYSDKEQIKKLYDFTIKCLNKLV